MKFRWTYLPPLLIYLSAGVSGLTGIVGVFFLKDYLNLSAAFIASIGFWAGIPWALKMPIGFLVDKYWSKKNYLVFLGAVIVFVSILIMFLLISDRNLMETYLSSEAWYILSVLLTPIGYVLQDVVADAMTVEAIEEKKNISNNGYSLANKNEHFLLQLYGRCSIILGSLLVGLLNVFIFSGTEGFSKEQMHNSYETVYFLALFIPLLSVSGIVTSYFFNKNYNHHSLSKRKTNKLDSKIFIISILFVIIAVSLGSFKFPFSQEITLLISLILIAFLMGYLVRTFSKDKRNTIIGTAIIIFVYRSMPSPGAGLGWYEIDVLKFDQTFLAYLAVNASFITLLGLFFFKNLIINCSLARLFIILSILSGSLYLPSLMLYYGVQNITSSITNGIVDERFIAFINTAVESPVAQIAMIPLLGWIAKNAPIEFKATFFAVFASFTNLALSARELFTKYLNKLFIIKREIVDLDTGKVLERANYSDLDELLISIILITIIIPILTILVIQKSKYKSID